MRQSEDAKHNMVMMGWPRFILSGPLPARGYVERYIGKCSRSWVWQKTDPPCGESLVLMRDAFRLTGVGASIMSEA